ncbi:uncharacterized protein LOC128218238 isoform X2 [Mya arenaria]|uniref:uncharacterized protein LOC128218238 isoform X2 n=1 Tax=Mya arenaria TaxID=6604 RepID=UPI0022E8B545|nr:uncharacterized protein LOC128218238 isoform X2 [Mya arenaria]
MFKPTQKERQTTHTISLQQHSPPSSPSTNTECDSNTIQQPQTLKRKPTAQDTHHTLQCIRQPTHTISLELDNTSSSSSPTADFTDYNTNTTQAPTLKKKTTAQDIHNTLQHFRQRSHTVSLEIDNTSSSPSTDFTDYNINTSQAPTLKKKTTAKDRHNTLQHFGQPTHTISLELDNTSSLPTTEYNTNTTQAPTLKKKTTAQDRHNTLQHFGQRSHTISLELDNTSSPTTDFADYNINTSQAPTLKKKTTAQDRHNTLQHFGQPTHTISLELDNTSSSPTTDFTDFITNTIQAPTLEKKTTAQDRHNILQHFGQRSHTISLELDNTSSLPTTEYNINTTQAPTLKKKTTAQDRHNTLQHFGQRSHTISLELDNTSSPTTDFTDYNINTSQAPTLKKKTTAQDRHNTLQHFGQPTHTISLELDNTSSSPTTEYNTNTTQAPALKNKTTAPDRHNTLQHFGQPTHTISLELDNISSSPPTDFFEINTTQAPTLTTQDRQQTLPDNHFSTPSCSSPCQPHQVQAERDMQDFFKLAEKRFRHRKVPTSRGRIITIVHEAHGGKSASFVSSEDDNIQVIYDFACSAFAGEILPPKFQLANIEDGEIYPQRSPITTSKLPEILTIVEEDYTMNETVTNYDEVLWTVN